MPAVAVHANGEHVAVIVEVGSQIRKHVESYFEKNDIRVVSWAERLDADRIITSTRANLILLNLNLHENKAFGLCQQIKKISEVPVVTVTSIYTEIEKIVSLEMGADDCLPMDFNPRQVIARMRGVIGRQMSAVTAPDQNTSSGIGLNKATHQVRIEGRAPINLSPAEYMLMSFLVENAGRVLTREEIHLGIFGETSECQVESINVMVYRLRRKIELDFRKPRILESVRSIGYVLKLANTGNRPVS